MIALAIAILGCAGIALFKSAAPSPTSGAVPSAKPGGGRATDRVSFPPAKGEDPSIEDRPAGRTKFRERPGPEEIARNRIERRRAELMEELEKYKSSGLGSSHPAIVKTLDELKKIGAPLNVADEDNHPGN